MKGGQLLVHGNLTTATTAGARAIALSRDGVNLQASIGYAPETTEHLPAGQSIQLNGRKLIAGPQGLTIIRKGRLREVSLLSIGADSGTSVSVAAKGNPQMITDGQTTDDQVNKSLEAQLPENQSNLPEPMRVQARWQREKWADADGLPRQRAEVAMISACAGQITYADFERHLADRTAAGQRSRTHPRRAAPGPRDPQQFAGLFSRSNSLLLRATTGLGNIEKHFKPEVLEAANRFGRIGLQELLLLAASENGWTGQRNRISTGNIREVLGFALPGPGIRAGASTIDVAGILSNTANKQLLDGFGLVPATWREVAAIKRVNDFKENSFYRLTSDLEYEQVPASGKIPSGTLAEESYSGSAKTYAKLLALSRTQIINDDLGAFDTIRTKLGLGAAVKLARIFWTTWLAASNAGVFFSEANGNLVASAPLGDAGLTEAEVAYLALKTGDKAPLPVRPDRIIVPPRLGSTARKIFVSQQIRDTAESTRYPVGNDWGGMFRPVIVSELGNEAYPGYSDTTWYLLGPPQVIPTAALLFLDGVETPTIESADADFDELGILFRGYHDFGVIMAEPNGGVKCTAGA